jgi:hypothetical protein
MGSKDSHFMQDKYKEMSKKRKNLPPPKARRPKNSLA